MISYIDKLTKNQAISGVLGRCLPYLKVISNWMNQYFLTQIARIRSMMVFFLCPKILQRRNPNHRGSFLVGNGGVAIKSAMMTMYNPRMAIPSSSSLLSLTFLYNHILTFLSNHTPTFLYNQRLLTPPPFITPHSPCNPLTPLSPVTLSK